MTAVDQNPPTLVAQHRIDLTAAEREGLRALAEEVVGTPPGAVDDPAWLSRARLLTCHLPARLARTLRHYRHDSGVAGTLLVTGLPIEDAALPDTPTVAESVERTATVPAALAVLLGSHLGEVGSYRAEKSGALVHNVVPVHGLEDSQSNAGSEAELAFHTENAFHPHRPDYLGLICLREDHEKRARTLVSSIRHALPLLDPHDRAVLHSARFVTAPPPSFHSGADTRPQPVLTGDPEDPDVCVDFAATTALDPGAATALDRLRLALAESATGVVLRAGDMVFVDNRLVLHGRSRFLPRYDGRDRWLHRIYLHLDNRRTRGHRPANGAVLS
ncbi:TauD/TfdA family dioxygenase [Actinosynnema sp. NPDC059335]|uniref:TauD/TfdA family dioxygenase n=1 Tax=Actinosynnema sp. NPDC059335 TaxID=3346804 RepID=UPI003671D2C4